LVSLLIIDLSNIDLSKNKS
jgi:hypothetical protein